jgi:hypothetical protein
VECDSEEDYTGRLIMVLEILGDSESIGLAVCYVDTRHFFEDSFIEVHDSRLPLETQRVMWRFQPDLSSGVPADIKESVEVGVDTVDLTWIN